ncbi:hypothetical protein [Tsukamurella spumae]|uniref:Mce-associated membrane protein n=1 Tax=Tsukamurella spumae TaxID=44753 RepID=A0A846WXW8_9ACTN|nr:hypothetical protein [Tsukamurella spumae]NKY18018.1 hypothetical protein [Tsukamurella spumae]
MAATKPDSDGTIDDAADEADAPTAPVTPKVTKRAAEDEPSAEPEKKSRGIVVTPLMLGLAAIVVVLAVAATAFGFLWLSASSARDDARGQLASITRTDDRNAHAKDVAVKYAIGAATVDYQNLDPWRTALVANTTPELANTLKTASTDLEQVYVPLQWQSTATPLGAIVVSDKDEIMVVNVFVNVVTKSTQRPQGIPSVTTYALTIDTKQNWVISDVSSIDGALGGKK